MENRTYYYARVSSSGQNLDRQIEAFKKLGATDAQIVTDKQSGKDLERPGYQHLKQNLLRDGDTLIIKSLDRLSRSKADIKTELDYYHAHHITVKIIDVPTTMADFPAGQEWVRDMINNILVEVLSSMAEHERATIRQRQAEGIAAAKARGQRLGKAPLETPQNWQEVYTRWKSGEITAKTAMELTGTKRTSFYKLVKITEGRE